MVKYGYKVDYTDGAHAKVTMEPVRHFSHFFRLRWNVTMEYLHPVDEYDHQDEPQLTIATNQFRRFEQAEEWAHDIVIELRMNR
jgi:hypothetical protein